MRNSKLSLGTRSLPLLRALPHGRATAPTWVASVYPLRPRPSCPVVLSSAARGSSPTVKEGSDTQLSIVVWDQVAAAPASPPSRSGYCPDVGRARLPRGHRRGSSPTVKEGSDTQLSMVAWDQVAAAPARPPSRSGYCPGVGRAVDRFQQASPVVV